MTNRLILLAAIALIAAACGGPDANKIATLEGSTSTTAAIESQDALAGDEARLIDFSQCMRDNGFDLPDPDFSNFDLAGGVGPFGEIDPTLPDFEAALETCQDLFADFPFGG